MSALSDYRAAAEIRQFERFLIIRVLKSRARNERSFHSALRAFGARTILRKRRHACDSYRKLKRAAHSK